VVDGYADCRATFEGSEEVEIAIPRLMVIESGPRVVVVPLLSVTETVKEKSPTRFGVPDK
jgi:hypothetical protein